MRHNEIITADNDTAGDTTDDDCDESQNGDDYAAEDEPVIVISLIGKAVSYILEKSS